MPTFDASALDYAIIAIYFVTVLGVGFLARSLIKTDLDFFLSGRSLPAWITGLAFIAANLGALEILGMAANGAQYGVATVHFYWLGAIPAMVFLGLVMMPFYYGSKVRSVPEYLRRRYGNEAHLFNALSFAVATVLIGGVNLFALGLVLSLMLGWSINTAILLSAAIVLTYITLGGLTSAIYNEVIQFFVIVAALGALVTVALIDVGGLLGPRRPGEAVATQGGGPACLGGHGHRRRQPDRGGLGRHGVRARLRAVVRLLDHQLRRGPARAFGEGHERGPADAADRRLPEAVHPAPGRHPRSRGARDGQGLRRPARPTSSSTTTRSRRSWPSTCRAGCSGWRSRR